MVRLSYRLLPELLTSLTVLLAAPVASFAEQPSAEPEAAIESSPPPGQSGPINSNQPNQSGQSEPANPIQPASRPVQAKPVVRPPARAVQQNLRAQVPGSLAGTVTGVNGQPIIGARIDIVKHGSPHVRFEVETDRDGHYLLPKLEPGIYKVSFSAAGMLSHDQQVHVESAKEHIADIALEDVEASDVLRVTGTRTLIHPENVGTRTNLDRRFLNEYGSGNDLREDIESTPGVVRDSVGNIITRGEHNAVNYEIDGVILPEAAGVLNQSQFASPRSLESITVDIGGYQAKDGGGPLGAVVRMRSLPIPEKPEARIGTQIGGPIQGGVNYYAAGALSQDPHSIWNKVKVQSSGLFYGTALGIESPVKHWNGNGRGDINTLTKVEFTPTEKDKFKLTVGLNGSFLNWPTSKLSRQAGVRLNQYDREDYVILGYRRLGEKFFDEANLNIVNAFYSTRFWSRNVFDPRPILVGEEPFLASTAPTATRFNYIFSAQGDVRKRLFKTHNLSAGFLSEVRPVRTRYSAFYYSNDPAAAVPGAAEEVAEEGGEAGAEVIAPPPLVTPIGALISPFTRTMFGPQFLGNTGDYKGFRYLQSAYLQDVWRPQAGILKRLTVDAGVRFDLYHGVFGNTMAVANLMAQTPGVQPFDLQPFKRQTVTNAQVSGRFGIAYALTNKTAIRGSFAQIFQPPPVDLFSTPPNLTEEPVNGIYPGTLRPLQATRGFLVDTSIEQQVGSRFAMRTNLFYKCLKNFGDSGVVQNTPLYNRLTLAAQEAYGVESRLELKPARDGFGLHGFVSSTIAVAKLTGSKKLTGGIYEFDEDVILNTYPDHDRRMQLVTGLGYRARCGLWALADAQVLTGVKNGLDPAIYGPHGARTPAITLVGLNMGYDLPTKVKKSRALPSGVDVRIENLLNQTRPLNLGSPYQGTRYALPFRVIAGLYWKV